MTNDEVSEIRYWNKKRILAAEVYQFPVYQFLSDFIRKNNSEVIIDIGCGVGRKLKYVNEQNPDVRLIGIDQRNPINYCKSTYSFGEWYIDDFENSQLSVELNANVIISSDVIEHLLDPDLLLNYIRTKLDKDGVVILSTTERDLLRGV